MERSAVRANRTAGVFSGALVVFLAFAVYCWVASDGMIDSPRILGIAATVMALPTAFVVFAGIRMRKVLGELQVPPSSILYFRILKPSVIVALCVSFVVGIVCSFSLDSLGTVGTGSRIILFVLGFLGAAAVGMAVVSLTSLIAYAFASNIAKRTLR